MAEDMSAPPDSGKIYAGLSVGVQPKVCPQVWGWTQGSRCCGCPVLSILCTLVSLSTARVGFFAWRFCLMAKACYVLENGCHPRCSLQPETDGNWCLIMLAPSLLEQLSKLAFRISRRINIQLPMVVTWLIICTSYWLLAPAYLRSPLSYSNVLHFWEEPTPRTNTLKALLAHSFPSCNPLGQSAGREDGVCQTFLPQPKKFKDIFSW